MNQTTDSRRTRALFGRLLTAAGVILAFNVIASRASAQTWTFTDVTAAAGVFYQPGYTTADETPTRVMGGGAAAGDYDGDGWVDLYVIRGNIGPNLLFRNRGDGTFEDVAAAAGLDLAGGSGPTFADVDGDGRLDLVVGGTDGGSLVFFRNIGGGHFSRVTTPTGIVLGANVDVYSTAFGDYDHDGDLDLATTHWQSFHNVRLWRNDGNFHFTEVTGAAGLTTPAQSNSFTPNFADVNNDGWPDLLVSADFGTSQYYLNNRNGTFTRATNAVITDENGMGSAVGDYDNDGDLDWFVSSIWSATGVSAGGWGITGNRLYKNRGDGTFEDATDAAGVRHGYWGWGSVFADFNNDGKLDLFHVNGFPANAAAEFFEDPARFFVSNGDGTFTQQAESLGIADTGQGRGVVCFDYDGDGDLDVFLTNMLINQPPKLYRNDGGNALNYLSVRLSGAAPNTGAIGARISVTANGVTQMRELRAGSNFVSADPTGAFFGLGNAGVVDEVRVVWPDGNVTRRFGVATNQALTISEQGGGVSANVPMLGGSALLLLAVALGGVGAFLALRR
jgi:enediyne biosynthesis protein E4